MWIELVIFRRYQFLYILNDRVRDFYMIYTRAHTHAHTHSLTHTYTHTHALFLPSFFFLIHKHTLSVSLSSLFLLCHTHTPEKGQIQFSMKAWQPSPEEEAADLQVSRSLALLLSRSLSLSLSLSLSRARTRPPSLLFSAHTLSCLLSFALLCGRTSSLLFPVYPSPHPSLLPPYPCLSLSQLSRVRVCVFTHAFFLPHHMHLTLLPITIFLEACSSL